MWSAQYNYSYIYAQFAHFLKFYRILLEFKNMWWLNWKEDLLKINNFTKNREDIEILCEKIWQNTRERENRKIENMLQLENLKMRLYGVQISWRNIKRKKHRTRMSYALVNH